jgi:hypothetical protein
MGAVSDPLLHAGRSRPATVEGARAFVVTPFQRLARTHSASAMADAMFTAALADSLFFSLPADSAREPVVRYLLITMLPFAVIAPVVGPLMDRLKGGHRFVLIGSILARAILAYLIIGQISSAGPTFFLLALCVLVAQRAYHVARSAIVPTVVASDDELIEANSKLAIISGVSAFIGVIPAALLMRLAGPGWALGLAVGTYLVATVLGTRIPSARVAAEKPDAVERWELRGAGILLAGSAMSLLRMCVGFVTLLIAFDFRGGDRHPWEFAVVAGVSVAAGLAGAVVAPRLKAVASLENILTGSLMLVVAGTLFSVFIGEVLGACIVGGSIAFAAATGKLAFDSILQRDAPDANRGRSFARYETRFQLAYVLGAFLPVAITMGARPGFVILLLVASFATVSYGVGRLASAHRAGDRQNAMTAAAVVVDQRVAVVTGEVRGRLAAAPRSVLGRLRSDRSAPPAGDPTVVGDPVPGAPRPAAPGVDPTTVGQDATVVAPDDARAEGPVFDQDEVDEIDLPPAWLPDPAVGDLPAPTTEFPWEPPAERPEPPGAYLADLDPSVTNPFPWTPDDDTTVLGPPPPRRRDDR